MSILTDLKNVVVNLRQRVNNLSNRVFEVERSSIVSLCSASLSNYNEASDRYLTVTYTRSTGTVAMTSTLSNLNGSTGLYMQRTELYYNSTGTDVIRTVVYSITYNSLREPVSEAIVSVTP